MNAMRVRPAVAHGVVHAPPSKSYTHRALVVAFLAGRKTRLRHPLDSEDTVRTARGLEELGAEVRFGKHEWTVRPAPGPSMEGHATIHCGSSGTTLRFLVALAGLRAGTVRFVGSAELAARPVGPLLESLEGAGVRVARAPSGQSLPLEVTGPLHAGPMSVDATASSQFVSALLLALPTLEGRSVLRVRGSRVSAPYIRATIALQGSQGVTVRRIRGGYSIAGGQTYRGGEASIPGDASSSAYLWASAAVTGGKVRVRGIDRTWPQADLAVLDVLHDAGATVRTSRSGVEVGGRLSRGIDANLDDAPDLLPLLSAVAAVTPGRHRLSGAAHARWKESDRRRGSSDLGRLLGGSIDSSARSLTILGAERPRAFRHVVWTDHRLVMSAAVGALGADRPSTIGSATSVRKSYPGFWRDLRSLGVRCARVP